MLSNGFDLAVLDPSDRRGNDTYVSLLLRVTRWGLFIREFILFIWVLFGQLDLFILQCEEVLCDGFDLTVLDPSDRKGTDTYVLLLLRMTRWGLFRHK